VKFCQIPTALIINITALYSDCARDWTVDCCCSDRLCGPPNNIFKGYRGETVRSGHEADNLPTSNAEVRSEWNYTSVPPYMPSWHA